jgi:hypothetical protein
MRLAGIAFNASRTMLLRDFFFPSLTVACLVFAAAFAATQIWEAMSLFVYI